MYRKAGDFEDPIIEIRKEIEKLSGTPGEHRDELAKLQAKLKKKCKEIYSGLTPWQRTLVARHPDRPYIKNYIGYLCSDFIEIHGDRAFADDMAIVGGFAVFRGRQVMILGQEKGRTTKEKIMRNFGMARPEGYRKALRLMKIAEQFNRPVITFVDTSGAYPGVGAEKRGQAEAIARNLREMASLRVPIISTITGEGGSGGALGIAVADRVNILEFSIYSVISPEGCAAILYKDSSKAEMAASSLKLTAPDLKEFGLVDEIIEEIDGGAHSDPEGMAAIIGGVLERQLDELAELDTEKLLEERYRKFRNMGVFGHAKD